MNAENLIPRTHKLFRFAVAIQTPAHLQGFGAPGQRHIADGAVASGAANALTDVNAVIEIDKVGHSVHAAPLDGFVIAVAGANRLEHRAVHPYLRVARHAGLRWRHSSIRRGFNRGVAIAAIQTKFADVMFVAERHRLIFCKVHIGDVRRLGKFIHSPTQRGDQERSAVDAHASDGICAAMEELCHEIGLRRRFRRYVALFSSDVSSTKPRISEIEMTGRKRMNK